MTTEDMNITLQPLLEDEETFETDAFDVTPRPSRRRRIWTISLIALVVIVVLVAGGSWLWMLRRPKPVQYTQIAATTGNMSIKVSTTGPLNAGAQYSLNFATSGQVSEVDVKTGQHVTKGQTLAKVTVDMTSLNDALQQAQIAVQNAQNNVNNAQDSLSQAQTDAQNQTAQNSAALAVAQDKENSDTAACNNPPASSNSKGTPTPAPTPSPACLQTAQDTFNQTQAQLNSSNTSAQEKVTSAENQVTSANTALSTAQSQEQTAQDNVNNANTNAVLTAPDDGTIAVINGVVGQNVSGSGTGSSGSGSSGSGSSGSSGSSSSSSSAFMILTNNSSMTITAQVNEADIGSIQQGQAAQFTVAAYPSSTFRASVSSVETIGQTSSNVVTYPVVLTVDTNSIHNENLYPGMTATVDITTAQRIGAVLLPAAALSFPSIAVQNNEISRASIIANAGTGAGTGASASTGSSGSTQTQTTRVVLQLVNGKLTPKTITVGLNNGQFVEVLSGLQAGDEVVTSQTGGTTTTSSTTTGRTGAGGFGGGGGFFTGGGGGGGGGGGAGANRGG